MFFQNLLCIFWFVSVAEAVKKHVDQLIHVNSKILLSMHVIVVTHLFFFVI